MKKPTTATETPIEKAKTEKPTTTKATKKVAATEVAKMIPMESTVSVSTKATTGKPVNAEVPEASANIKAAPKKASPKPKPGKKTSFVQLEPSTATPEIPMNERIGLNAGRIWHYLAENGATTTVAKLVDALPEEEAIIQRSIGWLAQEDKISLSVVDQVETVALKG
jgi:hypothetical protein